MEESCNSTFLVKIVTAYKIMYTTSTKKYYDQKKKRVKESHDFNVGDNVLINEGKHPLYIWEDCR